MGLDPTPITDVDVFTASVPRPQVGSSILAEDVEAVGQAVANRTDNLNLHKLDKIMQSGQVLDVLAGAHITIESGANITNNGLLDLSAATSFVKHHAPQRPVDAATINFDWINGPAIVLPSPSAVHNCVVLDATATAAPVNGQRVRVSLAAGVGPGVSWKVSREGGTLIALLGTDEVPLNAGGSSWSSLTTAMVGAAYSATKVTWPSYVDLQYEGGVWRGFGFAGFVQFCAGW